MTIINDLNLPGPVIDALGSSNYTPPEPGKLSVTTLIDSPYIKYLKDNYSKDIIVKASSLLWTLEGSALHYVLEQAGSRYITELRLEKEVDGTVISGQVDVFDPVEQHLMDYKRTSTWNVVHNPKGDKKWHWQLNINAFLFEQHGIKVNKLSIITFFRDWKKSDAMQNPDYPQSAVMIIDIPRKSTEEVIAYIRERIELFKNLDPKTAYCSDEERWKKEDKYAVKKTGASKAYRVYDTAAEALSTQSKMGANYQIEFRQGGYPRCEEYCAFQQFCNAYKQGYMI